MDNFPKITSKDILNWRKNRSRCKKVQEKRLLKARRKQQEELLTQMSSHLRDMVLWEVLTRS